MSTSVQYSHTNGDSLDERPVHMHGVGGPNGDIVQQAEAVTVGSALLPDDYTLGAESRIRLRGSNHGGSK